MRVRILAAAVVLAGTLLCIGTACELVLPTHAKDDVTPTGTSSSGTSGTNGTGGDTCPHVLPPSRPAGGAGAGTIGFVTAVDSFPKPDVDAASLGLDLDGVCTTDAGPESCHPHLTGSQDPFPHQDGYGGRDLSGNLFLSYALEGELASTKQGDVNARIAKGILGYVVEVRGYNGTSNQTDDLLVGMYDSNGLYTFGDGGALVHVPPTWNGDDYWTIDCLTSAAYCPGSNTQLTFLGDASTMAFKPGFHDEHAYVANDQLVARFPTLVIHFNLSSVRMSDVTLLARIVEDGSGYRLDDGQLAGRITTAEAQATVARIHDESSSSGFLCGDNPNYVNTVRPTICAAADLAADPNDRNVNTPCDAMSFAIAFSAKPAKIGYRYDRDPIPQGCNGSVDDCGPTTP